mgnify:CR=1 FL=1|tara:strand:+ start:342 stop:956 length:615 start_codon:yes stop_codon:yes gene_type:complete
MHKKDMSTYCNYLEDIKSRLELVKQIVKQEVVFPQFKREDFLTDFVAIQIRKSLEAIAFSSLIANKEVYSAQYKNFVSHWNAKFLLKDIKRLNPNFYPKPLGPIVAPDDKGVINLKYLIDGFIDEQEFIFLYEKMGKLLHAPNPYSNREKVDLKYPVSQWVERIFNLLNLHQIQLLDESTTFVVYFSYPGTGKATALYAEEAQL